MSCSTTMSTRGPNDEQRFSTQVQMALSQLSSKFAFGINEAFETDPATEARARESKLLAVNPMEAIRKQQILEENKQAIDRDMRILHQAKQSEAPAATTAAQFEGFKALGRDDYIEALMNELNDSDFDSDDESEYDSDDSDSDDDDDSDDDESECESDTEESPPVRKAAAAVQPTHASSSPPPPPLPQQTVAEASVVSNEDDETKTGRPQDANDDDDESSEEDDDESSEEDDSDYDDSDYDSDFDDDSSLGSFDDLMSEMQNEMGFTMPDALTQVKMNSSMMSIGCVDGGDDQSFHTAMDMSVDSRCQVRVAKKGV